MTLNDGSRNNTRCTIDRDIDDGVQNSSKKTKKKAARTKPIEKFIERCLPHSKHPIRIWCPRLKSSQCDSILLPNFLISLPLEKQWDHSLWQELKDDDTWEWQGYVQRRKVLQRRYENGKNILQSANHNISSLDTLVMKLHERASKSLLATSSNSSNYQDLKPASLLSGSSLISLPTMALIEEYPIFPMALLPLSSNSSSFEHSGNIMEKDVMNDNSYYVAQLVLSSEDDDCFCCWQQMDCPVINTNGWKLQSPLFYFTFESNMLYLKTNDALRNWRSRIIRPPSYQCFCCPPSQIRKSKKGLMILKLTNLPHELISTSSFHYSHRNMANTCGFNEQFNGEEDEYKEDTNHTTNDRKIEALIAASNTDIENDTNVKGSDTTIDAEILNGVSTTDSSDYDCTPSLKLTTSLIDDDDTKADNKNIPVLSDLLTVIVTTSPIQSNPSTELLERIFDTFRFCGIEFLKCPKLVICDGVRINTAAFSNKSDKQTQQNPSVSQKYATVKQALRNGIVSPSQDELYEEFKRRLHKLCDEHCDDPTHPFYNTWVEELTSRHGYGFALRHALSLIQTPYVCVIQHDRTFMRRTPLEEVVHTMYLSQDKIKYVGMSMRSNLQYRDIFCSKYGKSAHEELSSLILYPPSLLLSNNEYGNTDSRSIQSMFHHLQQQQQQHSATSSLNINPYKKLQTNLRNVANSYLSGSRQAGLQRNAQKAILHSTSSFSKQNKYVEYDFLNEMSNQQNGDHQHGKTTTNGGYHQLTLTPIIFWYDNIHVVDTKHYRDFIFSRSHCMVNRGGFVEESTSPFICQSIERLGLHRGHARFGTYLLDDHSGYFFTGHLDGGNYKPVGDNNWCSVQGTINEV